ncbi:damage-inducible protein DinB [Massilia sp. CCM 8695]|uniref:Damage-inducible protein DinB n=1 Tax=Massilia frigida TaxID=2609281 RepID=A0ABX0NDF6_9BURK|nr:DinB family protein [Massilia frigida]NHZ80824.1 damage-inducible protein DinB [Massilia frigida]
MSASTLLHSLFKYKAWANEELFFELEKLDPATHQAELHAAVRLLNHIYVVDRIFAAHLSGIAHSYTATNTPETPTFDELRHAVTESDRWYVAYIENLAPDLLSESVPIRFTDGANGLMSREEMLAHVATHGGYHRGAIGRIMAQVSVPPPPDVFTVYLHRSEPERRAGYLWQARSART